MGALTRREIVKWMRKTPISERLVVTPLLDAQESLDASSVNVRLGNEFIVMRKQAFPLLNLKDKSKLTSNIQRYQERVRLRYGQEFVLHPRQLIIGSTFEYISIPKKLMCYMTGKSTWGRMGLIIATATKVDPGFRGSVTLEIINEGEVPIVIYPGIPIAQLVFHKVTSPVEYAGRYMCPTGPEFPNFTKSSELWEFWYEERK